MQMTFTSGKWIEVKLFFKYFMQMTFTVGKWIEVKPFFKYFMQLTFTVGKWIEVKPFFKYFMQMTFTAEKWIEVKPFFKYFMQTSCARKQTNKCDSFLLLFLYVCKYLHIFYFFFFLFFWSWDRKILWHLHFSVWHMDAHLPNVISSRAHNAEVVFQILNSSFMFQFWPKWKIFQNINVQL